MIKKTKFLLCALAVVVLGVAGCGGGDVARPDVDDDTIIDIDKDSTDLVDWPDGLSESLRDKLLAGTNWKLIAASIFIDQQRETFDYSEKNIIYEFQGKIVDYAEYEFIEEGKLTVSGEIDDLLVFNDFRKGEHFYEHYITCPTCFPWMNLTIDRPPDGFYFEAPSYFLLYDDSSTMRITTGAIGQWHTDEDGLPIEVRWNKHFIKLK